jgi:DNA polymerase III subunit epsilon
MREIVLDTETTGFNPAEGHMMVEIGAIELHNHLPTGKIFHQYINPERDVPIEAQNVHGLTEDFLKDYPTFPEIVSNFIDFIGDSTLIIHNAEFDMKFINHQLGQSGFPIVKNRIIDTLLIAREKFPGSPANLDALCRRFAIDNSNRTFHGALLDSELLAEVYIELMGGRQHGLGLAGDDEKQSNESVTSSTFKRSFREARTFEIPTEDGEAHKEMLTKLKKSLWGETA